MKTKAEALEWLKAYIEKKTGWIRPIDEKNFRKAIKILERENHDN